MLSSSTAPFPARSPMRANPPKTIPWWHWAALVLPAIALLLVIDPGTAHASSTSGSLPWDTPLTTLKNDITGSVAFTISLLAMVACGAALVFGGEIHEFVRRIIMLVLVASFIVGATNLASALGITGAIV